MSEDPQTINDPSDLKKYRTELPNIYDDAELDVYEFRLLAHYKRVGKCTESLTTTAKKCKCSEGKVSEARHSLAVKGFIALQRVSMDQGRYRFIVTVVDRWIENFAKYSGLSIEEIDRQVRNASPSRGEASPSRGEASPSRGEASPSRGEGKKELLKNLKTLSPADFSKMTVEEARQLPTLKMYAAGTDFFPGSVVWEFVHTFILDNHLTVEKIKAAAVAWSLRGYRKENVEGILQWARDGVPEKGAANGSKNSRTGSGKSVAKTKQSAEAPAYSDADRAAAEIVRKRQQQPTAVS